MAERKKPVDAVIIGYGWTGAIMAKTLTDAGLSVVALERGPAQDTSPDFEYPRIADELKYGIRGHLWQPLARETVTVRHSDGPGTLGEWSADEVAQFLLMGYERVFPRLAGNPIVQAPNPLSVVSVVLEGSRTPRTAPAPAQFTMPGFAWRLSDQDVADVVNFVRTSWGNQASATTLDAVSRTRSSVR